MDVEGEQVQPAPQAGTPPEPGHLVRRNRALAIGLAAVVGASAVSWGAASRIRSPAEVAARTAAPEASLITAPVEYRTLSSTVVVRGTVRYGAPQDVVLPVSTFKGAPGIVTTSAVKGRELHEGAAAMTISGRPLIVLGGAQPAYRDIGPGAVGDDVRQLEAAMSRLGFPPGAVDDTYDGATARAVEAWYRAGGWGPPRPTAEQLQNQNAGAAEWFAAQAELLSAQEALAVAQREVAASQSRAAAGTVEPVPASGSPGGSAPQAQADQRRVQAEADVRSRRQELNEALEAERAAQARMEEARRRQPPPSNEEYAELSRQSREASDRVAIARDNLAAAEEAATTYNADSGAPSPADQAQAQREAAVAARDSRLDTVTAQAEVDKAAAALAFARQREALLAGRGLPPPGATGLGAVVPADEILFFPTLPLRIDEVKATAGEEASGPVMTVTNARLAVDSAISRADARLAREGAPVLIKAPDLGIDMKGKVTQVATSPGTNGVDPQRFYMEVTPDGGAASLVGASVVQTVTVESTAGKALVVPVSALSVSGDGATHLSIQDDGGKLHRVVVAPGLAAEGLVALDVKRGRLKAGDLVVIGRGTAKLGQDRDDEGGGSK